MQPLLSPWRIITLCTKRSAVKCDHQWMLVYASNPRRYVGKSGQRHFQREPCQEPSLSKIWWVAIQMEPLVTKFSTLKKPFPLEPFMSRLEVNSMFSRSRLPELNLFGRRAWNLKFWQGEFFTGLPCDDRLLNISHVTVIKTHWDAKLVHCFSQCFSQCFSKCFSHCFSQCFSQ